MFLKGSFHPTKPQIFRCLDTIHLKHLRHAEHTLSIAAAHSGSHHPSVHSTTIHASVATVAAIHAATIASVHGAAVHTTTVTAVHDEVANRSWSITKVDGPDGRAKIKTSNWKTMIFIVINFQFSCGWSSDQQTFVLQTKSAHRPRRWQW